MRLDPADLRADNGNLITVSISGYGLEGEWVDQGDVLVANSSLVEFDDPVAGRSRQPRPPAQFSHTPNQPSWPTPTPGQHTDEILTEAAVIA